MGGFSVMHWGIVLVVVLLIFGTKKIRNMGSDLGGAVRGFKEGIREVPCSEAVPIINLEKSAEKV